MGVYKGCFGVLDDEVQAGQHDVPDYKSYSDWSERQAKSEEVLSDEEDAKILEEERRKWEMKNELSGMNDGKG